MNCTKDVVRRLWPQIVTSQSSWINELVKIFNSTCVLNSLLNMLLKLTFKLGTLFHYKVEEYTRFERTINTNSRLKKEKHLMGGKRTKLRGLPPPQQPRDVPSKVVR